MWWRTNQVRQPTLVFFGLARALALIYNVNRYKLMAFVLSATLADAAKLPALGLASLPDVSWQMLGKVVLIMMLCSMGSPFVVCALVFRRCIVGEIEHRLKKP